MRPPLFRPRLRVLAPALALGLFAGGCAGSAPPPATSAASPSPSAAGVNQATTSAEAPALPFIEDDYPRALAEARASHKLLFVDGWAPWCHTCLSMRAYTFRDAKVRAHAKDIVWAAIDTEKASNAEWIASHPMHNWPTLFVVDAESGKTVLEWPSSATADELVRLLEVARESTHHEGVLAKAEARALDGNAAAVAGKTDEAIAAWRDALATAPEGWPGRAATLEILVDRLLGKKDYAGCVETADRELPKVPHGGARTATLSLMCATAMPPGEARRSALDRQIERGRAMAADETEPMLADDRSALYETVVDALESDGRKEEVKTVAGLWATYLEGEAQRAPDPTARAVFDAHRLDTYFLLDTPERAVPMLQATARDFPNDYNPPARLARVYLKMKRYDEALTAIDRGLALVYGPRTLRLVSVKADVLEAKGDRAGAARVLKEGVARVGSNVPPQYAPLTHQLISRAQALEAAH
jgi:tetratricopeptide (TPR) repeat protein